MKDIKCPVCGKPGIPDYHAEDVVCPQCKSDLSIYRVIDKIPDTGRNIWKPISAVAILAAAVCGFFLISSPKANQGENQPNNISLLNDSIKQLKTEIANLKSVPQKTSKFNYVVRKGDSYWFISKKLFGTGARAEDIVKANNRTMETPVYVGDTLVIFQ